MTRRIAAILLLEPALDENYERVKAGTYPWPPVSACLSARVHPRDVGSGREQHGTIGTSAMESGLAGRDHSRPGDVDPGGVTPEAPNAPLQACLSRTSAQLRLGARNRGKAVSAFLGQS